MDKSKIRKYLIIGLIGAIITVIGEMSQGFVATVDSSNLMMQEFETYASLPGWRHGFGSTVGAIGILLQFFGVHAIYLSFKNKDDKNSKRYKIGVFNYSVIGAIIHILLATSLYVLKISSELFMEYMIWFAMPFVIVFLIGYIWFSIIMFNKFCRNETIFPKWCCVLNPVIGKIFFNIVSALIPISALANGISYSNMGIAAIVIFAILLSKLKKIEIKE